MKWKSLDCVQAEDKYSPNKAGNGALLYSPYLQKIPKSRCFPLQISTAYLSAMSYHVTSPPNSQLLSNPSTKTLTPIDRCRKPVIAAIEGACIGGGTDIVIACDIWFRSKDAFFSVKEAGLGLTADSWTLQRLSGIVELGNAMELALTGLRFSGQEAKDLGLVYQVFGSRGIARGCENHSRG
ncbi:hypothetical protein Peur_056854 [Populus x canadensis]